MLIAAPVAMTGKHPKRRNVRGSEATPCYVKAPVASCNLARWHAHAIGRPTETKLFTFTDLSQRVRMDKIGHGRDGQAN